MVIYYRKGDTPGGIRGIPKITRSEERIGHMEKTLKQELIELRDSCNENAERSFKEGNKAEGEIYQAKAIAFHIALAAVEHYIG